jgi:hypothetical protein
VAANHPVPPVSRPCPPGKGGQSGRPYEESAPLDGAAVSPDDRTREVILIPAPDPDGARLASVFEVLTARAQANSGPEAA